MIGRGKFGKLEGVMMNVVWFVCLLSRTDEGGGGLKGGGTE